MLGTIRIVDPLCRAEIRRPEEDRKNPLSLVAHTLEGRCRRRLELPAQLRTEMDIPEGDTGYRDLT